VEICARVCRPRRARESPLFRLVAQHLEEFLRAYEERFAKAHGPLRRVVELSAEVLVERLENQAAFGQAGLVVLWLSVHNRVYVPAGDSQGLEALVRYMMRSPVSLSRLRFTPGSHEVV